MKKANKKAGFTLIEIMIVVAIIGLLAAIGIPSFQKARATTNLKKAEIAVKHLNDGVKAYGMANDLAEGTAVPVADYQAWIEDPADLVIGGETPTLIEAAFGVDMTVATVYPNL